MKVREQSFSDRLYNKFFVGNKGRHVGSDGGGKSFKTASEYMPWRPFFLLLLIPIGVLVLAVTHNWDNPALWSKQIGGLLFASGMMTLFLLPNAIVEFVYQRIERGTEAQRNGDTVRFLCDNEIVLELTKDDVEKVIVRGLSWEYYAMYHQVPYYDFFTVDIYTKSTGVVTITSLMTKNRYILERLIPWVTPRVKFTFNLFQLKNHVSKRKRQIGRPS